MLTLKALRDTWSHKGQFIALILLVALGILSYVTFQNGYYDLRRSLDTAYTRLRFADLVVRLDKAPFSAARRLERMPGVADARVRTSMDVGLELGADSKATARVLSLPDSGPVSVNAVNVERGRLPDPLVEGEAVLHPKFAAETKTGLGDTLRLRIGGERTTVSVVGIGTCPEYLYAMRSEGEVPTPGEFAVLYVSEREIERLFGTHGSGNEVLIRAEKGVDAETLADRVEDELTAFGVAQTTTRADLPGHDALRSELEQNRVMARSVPVLVLAISAMSFFIALSRLVAAQRGQIGLAKALGYTDAQILGHYVTFAVIIAAGGSIIGVALGLLGARGIAQSYVSILGIPFLESGFYPQVVAIATGLAVVTCVVAAAVPAWKSARLAPAEAMHQDPNLSLAGGRMPLIERALSPVLPATFTFRVPLRNIFRARRRSLYTVLGIAFAMVLSVVTVAMFDSMDYLLVKAFVEVERWDEMAVFERPFGTGRIDEIRRIDGVERVQPALLLPITISTGGREEDIILTAMRPGADFHGFTPVGSSSPESAVADGELVIAASTAAKLGVGVGQTVSVDSPYIDDPVRMTVGALSQEVLGQPGYASFDAVAAVLGRAVSEYNAVYLDVIPQRSEYVRDELYDMTGTASVQVKEGLVQRIKALLEMFNIFGSVMLVFGAALAFVVVFTTFTANITERTREIATMRTIGEDNRRLTAMVTLENLLLTLPALPLGVWLGTLAMDAIFRMFESESYALTAHIYPASIVRISLLMVGVVLLSEIPPVRRIFRLDLAEATKVME